MGNGLTKIDPYMSDQMCPQTYGDLNEAGTVYFVRHKVASDVQSNEVSKKTHFGLAIDITGESTKDAFCATHYDLDIEKPTNHLTYVGCFYKERPWDHYSVARKIGKIPLNEIQRFYIPPYFAEHLKTSLNTNVHHPMSVDNGGTKWSSSLNCQTFTSAAIQHLGFEFPSDMVVVSDCVPAMVDMYVFSRLTTAQALAAKQETIRSFNS